MINDYDCSQGNLAADVPVETSSCSSVEEESPRTRTSNRTCLFILCSFFFQKKSETCFLDRLSNSELITKVRSNQKVITRDIFNINLLLQTILYEVRSQMKLSSKDKAIKANGIY